MNNKKEHSILAIDAESNGLFGKPFAIAALYVPSYEYSLTGNTVRIFAAMVDLKEPIDKWVQENVIPKLNLHKFNTELELRNAFWEFMQNVIENDKSVKIVADFGVPVESNLLRLCQEDDPSRTWKHPYPLHELGTMLLAAGINPDISREEFVNLENAEEFKHHPMQDVKTIAACWYKAWEILKNK